MKICIIDGSHLCYRAYHVFSTFTNSRGKFTGMAYGFFSVLSSYYNQFNSLFVITWEGRNNWRSNIYPEYKKHREEDRDEKAYKEIIDSMQEVKNLCTLSGLLQMTVPTFEADDSISFIRRALGTNLNIVSGDKDLLQLISNQDNVKVLRPDKSGLQFFDEETVKAKYGLKNFSDVVDYFAILGDSSDNIKGIRGFGKVKTARLLNEEKDPAGYLELINPSYKDTLNLNRKLIDLNNPETWIKEVKPENIVFGTADLLGLNSHLQELEIRAFNARDLIDNFYRPDLSNKLGNLLLNYKSIC